MPNWMPLRIFIFQMAVTTRRLSSVFTCLAFLITFGCQLLSGFKVLVQCWLWLPFQSTWVIAAFAQFTHSYNTQTLSWSNERNTSKCVVHCQMKNSFQLKLSLIQMQIRMQHILYTVAQIQGYKVVKIQKYGYSKYAKLKRCRDAKVA